MTVIYLDSVFLLNGLMDYFLLLATSRLAGIAPRRGRCILAAIFGGFYAAAVFFPNCEFLSALPVKLAAGTLLGVISFGGEERLLRLLLLFLGVSWAMAGAVLGLGLLAGGGVPCAQGVFYTDVSPKILLIAATAAYFLLTVVFRASAQHGLRGELLPVKLSLGGREGELTALWDSGNSLYDPVGHCPVLVVAPGSLDSCFPPGLRFLISADRLVHPADALELLTRAAPEYSPRLLPYQAVGTRGGLLLAVVADWAEIAGTRYEHLTLGLSPTELGTGYTALWGGEVKGGAHEKQISAVLETAAAAIGPAAGGGRPLHRRQRHSANASRKRTGGRALGAAGSGGSQKRTD